MTCMTIGDEGTEEGITKCLHTRANKEWLDTVQPARKIRDYVKVE